MRAAGRRWGAVLGVLLGVAGIVVPATPAQAHSVSGVGATNFQTTLSALSPAVAGIRLSVVENGSRLELLNTTGQDVIVRGYSGEPYARIGPGGVWLNDNSPATYLNSDRYVTASVPAGVDGKAAPRWRKVADGDVYRWHDHRVHWMLKTLPVPVAADPGSPHRVSDWTVKLEYAGQVLTATGSLNWVPGPSPYPWLLTAVGLAVVVAAAVFGRRTRSGVLAAATGLMLAADVLHSAGIAVVEPGSIWQRLGALFGSDATALLVWPFGLLAAWRIAAGSRFATAMGAVIAAILGFAMVLDDAPVWWRSSAPTGLSMNLNRATVAVVLGCGAGLILAAAILGWRSRQRRQHATPARLVLSELDSPESARPQEEHAAAGSSPAVTPADDQPAADAGPAPEHDGEPGVPDRPTAEGALVAAGTTRRSVAGYLAAGGAGMIVGAGVGVGVGMQPTDSATAADAGVVPLSDVGAARIAVHGARQAGIVVPQRPQAHGWVAGFDLGPTITRTQLRDLLRRWAQAAARLADGQPLGQPDDHLVTGSGPCSLTVTFGFGPSLFGQAGLPATARPAALAPLPAFPGEALDPAAGDGDLGVVVAADDPLVVFHTARVLQRLAAGTARLRWQQTGFAATPGATLVPQTGRNLMGQVDGTHNPQPAEPDFDTKIFVPAGGDQPAWLHGGSYLVVRRIRMLLDDWDTLTLDQQQAVIGRRKDTGAPLSGGDESTPANYGTTTAGGRLAIGADAHIRLAAPAFNNGAAMLRRGLSYTDGDRAGLLFLAYQADPRHGFIPVQQRLSGHDALARFIRHETSALFAMPAGYADGGYPGQALLEDQS